MMFGRLLHRYTIYALLGALAHDRILSAAKFALRRSLAFSYIGSVTARHSSSGHQPNIAAWYKEWNYRTLTEGATYAQLGQVSSTGNRSPFVLTAVDQVINENSARGTLPGKSEENQGGGTG